MKRASVLAVCTVTLVGTWATLPASARAQVPEAGPWERRSVRVCPRADSLFGRLWRSHQYRIRVKHSPAGDTTTIRPLERAGGWETTSSRLVGTEVAIRIPGRDRPVDSARIELSLRFLDSLFRAPDQARLEFQMDSVPMVFPEPQVDYPTGVQARGVPVVVTVLLTPEQSLMLARAKRVRGTMGPFPFSLYEWELWDINSVYRATVCGID